MHHQDKSNAIIYGSPQKKSVSKIRFDKQNEFQTEKKPKLLRPGS